MSAPMPANEAERLAALRAYHVLDTEAEQSYDDITTLASHICKVPITMISLVDESRQWFKSKVGIATQETPRDIAFCAHVILHQEPFIVRDARKDPRFSHNDLVTGKPHVRFYAGFPLVNPEGMALGTLCAIDRKPRAFSPAQKKTMQALARQVIALLELRKASAHLACALEHVKILQGLLPICAWCKRIRDDEGYWDQLEAYFHKSGIDFTHGICPECAKKVHPDEIERQSGNELQDRDSA